MPKRVTSWPGPSPRHCALATLLLSKKCRSGGEPFAILGPIWPVWDFNLRPFAPKMMNALLLNQPYSIIIVLIAKKSGQYCRNSIVSLWIYQIMQTQRFSGNNEGVEWSEIDEFDRDE